MAGHARARAACPRPTHRQAQPRPAYDRLVWAIHILSPALAVALHLDAEELPAGTFPEEIDAPMLLASGMALPALAAMLWRSLRPPDT
jgi:hypothetical protein